MIMLNISEINLDVIKQIININQDWANKLIINRAKEMINVIYNSQTNLELLKPEGIWIGSPTLQFN